MHFWRRPPQQSSWRNYLQWYNYNMTKKAWNFLCKNQTKNRCSKYISFFKANARYYKAFWEEKQDFYGKAGFQYAAFLPQPTFICECNPHPGQSPQFWQFLRIFKMSLGHNRAYFGISHTRTHFKFSLQFSCKRYLNLFGISHTKHPSPYWL